jgi:hypothetical protein
VFVKITCKKPTVTARDRYHLVEQAWETVDKLSALCRDAILDFLQRNLRGDFEDSAVAVRAAGPSSAIQIAG